MQCIGGSNPDSSNNDNFSATFFSISGGMRKTNIKEYDNETVLRICFWSPQHKLMVAYLFKNGCLQLRSSKAPKLNKLRARTPNRHKNVKLNKLNIK